MRKFILSGLLAAGLLQAAGLAYSATNGPADDSVHAWGRWGQMIAPAAGPDLNVSVDASLAPETALELRPEEGQAFGRQVLVTNEPVIPVEPELPVPEVPVVVPGSEERPPGNPRDQFTPVVVPGADARPGGNPRDQF